MTFRDRTDAGQRLALEPAPYQDEHPFVVGLPRGGVPVAFEVARALRAPLEVFVARKLGAPFHPELGLGALAEDGTVWVGPTAERLGVGEAALAEVAEREQAEAARRVQRYRAGRPFPDVAGRTVTLVDDGVATGGTARAALRALRTRGPARLVLAVPVAAADTVAALRDQVDDPVCVMAPEDLWAIGHWYHDFRQVTDEEVVRWLQRSREEATTSAEVPDTGVRRCRSPGARRASVTNGEGDRERDSHGGEPGLRGRGRGRRDASRRAVGAGGRARAVSCCSRTAAGAAGTVPATATWRRRSRGSFRIASEACAEPGGRAAREGRARTAPRAGSPAAARTRCDAAAAAGATGHAR